jgi:hypothetical protein
MSREEKIEACVEKEIQYLLARFGDPNEVEDLLEEVWEEFEGMNDGELDERLSRG